MKNINKLLALLVFAIVLTGCETNESVVFDAQNGQTALSFAATSFNISIPQEDFTLNIPVQSTTSSSVDRSFNVMVDGDLTTGPASEYTIGGITIPAGEFIGTLAITFDFSAIGGMDGEVKDLVLSIDAPQGSFAFNEVATISYFREIVCNDLELLINFDDYPGETSWEITEQDTGNVVATGGNYSGSSITENINLPDGCYTYTIFDAFSDGICCAYGNGSYSLTCSILTHASGGEFGASESTDFCVNP